MKLGYSQENNIDFIAIEKQLGFVIHPDLKEFYEKNIIDGDFEINFDKKHLETSLNRGNWFNESKKVFVVLYPNEDLVKFVTDFVSNFNQKVIYGDENILEKRYMLGTLSDERGQMSLLFNNENGNIEWCDFEYGADRWEENPRGVISNNIHEFVNLLR